MRCLSCRLLLVVVVVVTAVVPFGLWMIHPHLMQLFYGFVGVT